MKLSSSGTSDHVEGSFGHVCMRMILALVIPAKYTFHRRDIHNPRWSATQHLTLQLTDQVERNDRVDDLCSIAVEERNILNGLYPGIGGSQVERLAELVIVLPVDQMTLGCQSIGHQTRNRVVLAIPDNYAVFLFVLLFNSQLSLFHLLVEELFRPYDGLGSIIDEYVKLHNIGLDILNQ